MVLEHVHEILPATAVARQSASERLKQLEQDSRKVPDAFYADANDTPELPKEQARIAAERAEAETQLTQFTISEERIVTKLNSCLDLLGNAHGYYSASDAKGRRDLNQSVFAHIYVLDDDIIASDLTPPYQILMNDNLAAELESERKREQNIDVRIKDLIRASEVAEANNRGQEWIPRDLPAKARRIAPNARIPGSLAVERPRGQMPWERKNHGP